ncbi:MAG: 16S rRNA (cytidine(1402)-2'-O)-methyltransferase [Sphaerochaetaceae bacterium]|nr:16S rRNA (cytidine(1402)-2'-O)-methyltransferase [Sphaerochaetaceae bacterium]
MSILYIVATPIGNMSDITLRAVETLKSVDTIACEDTRHTSILLNHLGIQGKSLIACHARNEENSANGIVKLLSEGHDVAYCSDAGTPGVSDPGSRLVRIVRAAGFKVVPIPGASASVTLISASGLAGKTFTFEGFLSPKSGRRQKRLNQLLERDEAFIIYESPFRIQKTLEELKNLAPERTMVLGREMTKTFEEFITGTAEEVLSQLKTVKGEFALCVLPTMKVKEEDEEDAD